MNTAATANQVRSVRLRRTCAKVRHPRVPVISSAAVAKPNTMRQTTTSQGEAKVRPVITSGKLPQMKYAIRPKPSPVPISDLAGFWWVLTRQT